MYQILVMAEGELNVCTGTYKTYEDAKAQLQKMIIHLITQNDAYDEGEWETWKEKFPEEVQTVLTALEKAGSAPAGDYDMDGEVANNCYFLRDNDLDIDIADDEEDAPAYKVSTNLFETGGEADSHSFYLWNNGEGLILMMQKDEE